MLNAVQVLVTPQGKHIPNQINLGSKTLRSIIQLKAVWCHHMIALRNNAAGRQLLQHLLQGRGERGGCSKPAALQTLPKGTPLATRVQRDSGSEPSHGGWGGAMAGGSMCTVGWTPLMRAAGAQPRTGIPLYSSSPFVPMALLPTVLDNEWCSQTLLFHTLWVTYNFSWVTFDLRTDSLIYCPVLWFMSIFSE